MNTIVIPTTRNIELEYPIANPGDRVLAAMIDLGVLAAYVLALVFLTGWFDIDSIVNYTAATILSLPVIFYHLICESLFNGQSLGKYLMKMRVIHLDGSSATFTSYALRWMLRIVDISLSSIFGAPGAIGLVVMSINKNGQRLGDILAGTTVIKLKLVTTFSDTIFVETADNYEVVFPEIQHLSDKDMAILKEVLDAGLRAGNRELLQKLAQKVKQVAVIETQMPDRIFLETVLSDYNHVFGKE